MLFVAQLFADYAIIINNFLLTVNRNSQLFAKFFMEGFFTMFYEKLQELCKNKGISVSQMCLDLGFAKSSASRWKSGRNAITNKNIKLIADYFGVPVSYFTEEEKEKGPAAGVSSARDMKIRALSERLSGLSDEQLDALLRVLKIGG